MEGISFANLLHWGKKSGLAVLDQGLFSGANFLLNILLARWLSPEEYGAFAVAYSIFLLLAAYHTSFLTEPMLVFGSGKYSSEFPKYLGFLLYIHWVLVFVASAVLGITAIVFWKIGQPLLGKTFLGLAIALPFILLLWITRRGFYVRAQPDRAAFGGCLYMVVMLVGMCGLNANRAISPFLGLLTMGVASAVVSCGFLIILKPEWRLSHGNPSSKQILKDQWSYAKWSGGTTLLIWIPGNIYYSLLPLWTGLQGAAALRALINLLMPILQATSAISVLLVPQFTKCFRDEGFQALNRLVRLCLTFFMGAAFVYWLFLFWLQDVIVEFVYGPQYNEFAYILPVIGLLPVTAGVVAILGGALRAMERPNLVFASYIATTAFALTAGLALVKALGVSGAATSLILSSLTTGLMMIYFYVRKMKADPCE